ncbi:MAG: DMT family transporter [Thermomicrobiales bacterium]
MGNTGSGGAALGSAHDHRFQGLMAINIAAVIFGTAALFGKIDVSAVWIVDLRAVFAAIALLALAVTRRQLHRPPSHLIPSLIATGTILALHWVTFFVAVQFAGIAVATLTFATFPFFTVLVNGVLSRERPRLFEVAAGLIIVIAVGLLVNVDLTGANQRWGALAGIGSAVLFALFGIFSKTLGAALSPVLVSLYQNMVVAIVLLPLLPIVGRAPDRASEWMWLVVLGVVTTALMHQLYFYALQRLSPTTCSGFVALEPVYAILFASIFFHEPLSVWVVVSAGMILSASFMLLKLETSIRALPVI